MPFVLFRKNLGFSRNTVQNIKKSTENTLLFITAGMILVILPEAFFAELDQIHNLAQWGLAISCICTIKLNCDMAKLPMVVCNKQELYF